MRNREPELWKGVVAGAVAGLAASWIMTQFQTGWNKMKQQRQTEPQSAQENEEKSEDATMKTAGAIARTTFGTELSKEQKQRLSPVVHYAFGTLMGATYGALSEEFKPMKSGWGTLFGTALFLGADEIAVPLLGLGSSPTESPLSTHLYAWASHLVYGAAVESIRRLVRSSLGYDDLGAKVSRAQTAVTDNYERVRDFAGSAKKRVRSNLKSGLKTVEQTARRMRKAA